MSEQNKSIKSLLDEFQQIVDWFDQENLDIEQAIAKFEEGSALAEKVKTQLNDAKNKVEILKEDFKSKSRSETKSDSEE
jgi:exodeoxyribonuclease VII small subunit